MPPHVSVLGIDPGFASLGLALVHLRADGNTVVTCAVLETAKSAKKRHVLQSDDNVRRAEELGDALGPWLARADLISAEAMSFPRNSSAAHKVGIAWGVIVTLARARAIPIVQTSPQEVKRGVTGSKTASKQEVQLALQAPLCAWGAEASAYVGKLAHGKHEHLFDAVACALAARESDVTRAVLRARGAA